LALLNETGVVSYVKNQSVVICIITWFNQINSTQITVMWTKHSGIHSYLFILNMLTSVSSLTKAVRLGYVKS